MTTPNSKNAKLQALALEAQRLQPAGDRKARAAMDALVRFAMPLLVTAAKRVHAGDSLTRDDLVQVAAVTLFGQLAKYDPSRYEFKPWLLVVATRGMQRYVEAHGREVRVPEGVRRGRAKVGHTGLSFISRDALLEARPDAVPSWERTGERESAELELMAHERKVALWNAVRALPAQRRELVCLTYGINRPRVSMRNIARETGAPRAGLAKLLGAAQADLRGQLAAH